MKTLHQAALEKYGTEAEVAHQLRLEARRRRYAATAPGPKAAYQCADGPLVCVTLYLDAHIDATWGRPANTPATGVFTLHGRTGRYVRGCTPSNSNLIYWEETK